MTGQFSSLGGCFQFMKNVSYTIYGLQTQSMFDKKNSVLYTYGDFTGFWFDFFLFSLSYIIHSCIVQNLYSKAFRGSLCILYFVGGSAIPAFLMVFYTHQRKKCVKQKTTNMCCQQEFIPRLLM